MDEFQMHGVKGKQPDSKGYIWFYLQNGRNKTLLLLLLSRFSRVRLCATPQTAAHQAPLSLPGILQARTLEWVAISFSRGSFQPRDWTWVSCIEAKFLTIWATKVMQPILLVCGNRFLPVHNSCSRAFLLDAFFFFFLISKGPVHKDVPSCLRSEKILADSGRRIRKTKVNLCAPSTGK